MAKSTKSQKKEYNSSIEHISPEAQENEMIALAMRSAKQRMEDGTASASEIVHFLKLGTAKAKLELEILEKQKDLTVAKTEQIESSKKTEELFEKAIKAMSDYSGTEIDEEII